MRIAAASLLLLLASGCVEARFSRKGDLDSTSELSRETTKSPPELRIDGTVARVRYTETTCVRTQRTYLTENYETRHWPGQSIALLGTLVAGAAVITALSTDHEGFLWPEAMPAIQPISWATGVVVGAFSIGLGWIPWGSFKDQDVLISTVRSDAHDTVERDCEDEGYRRAWAMPWKVSANGRTVTGTTPKSGELDLARAAREVVTQSTIDEARFRALLRSRKVSLTVKVDDAPAVSHEIALPCLDRDPAPVIFQCKVGCAAKGGADRCQPQLKRCEERKGQGSSMCLELFETCLAENLEDRPAFDACQLECLQQDFVAACR